MYDMFSAYDGDDDSSEEDEMPHLSEISAMCSKDGFFYGLNPNHMKAVEMAKNILMGRWIVLCHL
jgi:hypothetical protein